MYVRPGGGASAREAGPLGTVPACRKRAPRKRVPRGAPSAPMSACAGGAGRAGMAFRQALQLAACGLAGGSAAVLFSAVAVGKPRTGGDADPRAVEPPAWAGAARAGPGVWDPNWDRCGPAETAGRRGGPLARCGVGGGVRQDGPAGVRGCPPPPAAGPAW